MQYHEFVPYDDLVDLTRDKFAYLDPNQRTDCTAEFRELSTDTFGDIVFGENATVSAAKVGSGVSFLFRDRVIDKNRGALPPVVAVLSQRGLDILNHRMIGDWASRRLVEEDGSIIFDELREAALNSPLPLGRTSTHELRHVVRNMAIIRKMRHLTPQTLVPGLRQQDVSTLQAQARTAEFAEKLRSIQAITEADVTDLAETLTTERRGIAHVLQTVGAAEAVEVTKPADSRELACPGDGLWIGVLHEEIDEMYVPGASDRHNSLDMIEQRFARRPAYRHVVAVGKALTYAEKQEINTYRGSNRVYITPLDILPHGTIHTNRLYRVLVPNTAETAKAT